MIVRRVALDLARAQALDRLCPRVVIEEAPPPAKVAPVFMPKFLAPELVAEIEVRYGLARPRIRKIQNLEVSDWKNRNNTRLETCGPRTGNLK